MIRYKFEYDERGYIIGFYDTLDEDFDYEGVFSDDTIAQGWYKYINKKFVEDLNRKAEIIAEKEAEALKPTWNETIEAQIMYTAMMTDTMLEE